MSILSALALSVGAAVLPTIAYVACLWWLDRYEKEPLWLFALAFLWGALPALMASLIVELIALVPLSALSGLGQLLSTSTVAPFVEEATKGAALLGLFWLYRAEFDGVLDGIIYGAVIGSGFAMTENVLYFFGELGKAGSSSFAMLWALRALVFGLNHSLYTSVSGVGLGLARLSPQAWRRWLLPPLAFAGAVLLHATHNLFSALAAASCWPLFITLASDWGGLAVVFAVAALSWRQERRWLIAQLREEVAYGVVTAEEYAILSSPGRRLARSWELFSRQGWRAARAWSRRAGWATELAFKKQQLATVGPTAGEAAAIDKLRAQLHGV